jgi:hypothetical protein
MKTLDTLRACSRPTQLLLVRAPLCHVPSKLQGPLTSLLHLPTSFYYFIYHHFFNKYILVPMCIKYLLGSGHSEINSAQHLVNMNLTAAFIQAQAIAKWS